MSRYLLVSTLLLVSLLSGCSQSNKTEITTESSETSNESQSEYFSKSKGIMTMFAKDGQTANYDVRRVSGEGDEPIPEQTVDKRIDTFIATYTAIPADWYFEKEEGGITIHASYTATDEQGASSILSNLTGISNTVTEQVGADVPLRLLEPGQTEYSVIFIGGKSTKYNEVYGKIIKNEP